MEFPPISHFAIFLAFIFFLLKLVIRGHKRFNTRVEKLPPGPWKLPLIGNMHHLIGSLPHHRLRYLAGKHGPLMHLRLGEISTVVISSPQMAKEVMKVHDLAFASRPQLLAMDIMFDGLDLAFAPYSDYWRQMRKICIIELLSAKNVKSFRYIREAEVDRLVASIQASSGLPINLTEMVFEMASTIISRAAFGKVCKRQDKLILLTHEAARLAGGFYLADFFPSLKLLHLLSGMKPKLLKMRREIEEIIEYIISEHMENLDITKRGSGESGEEDLVDVLLRIKETNGLEFQINNKHIKAVIFDMFSAGTATSSTTIEWVMSELMRNSRVMEKTQAEVRQILGEKKRIRENDIEGLKYLKLVIKETLRLHPPVPLLLPRECREQCQIVGYTIPIKTRVIVNSWAIGRDPEHWQEAEKFIPERFQDSSIDFTGNHFQYIPFGAGRRICPGLSLGLANVELPLAQLLYHFDWKLPRNISPSDLDMTETDGVAASRRNKLHLIAIPYHY